MLTVKQCREILEDEAEGLTDEEIVLIRDWLSGLADIAIESMEKNDSSNSEQ
jgi:hypothetical protein